MNFYSTVIYTVFRNVTYTYWLSTRINLHRIHMQWQSEFLLEDTILPDTTERITFLSFTGVSLLLFIHIKTISKKRKSYKLTVNALLFTFKRFLSEEKNIIYI